MEETIQFNADKITGRQAIFLQDKTNRTLKEFQQLMETQDFTARDALALAACAMNPDDPEAAWLELLDSDANAIVERIKPLTA